VNLNSHIDTCKVLKLFDRVATGSEGYPKALVETWTHSPGASSQSNRPPQRLSLITNNQQNLLKAHQDCITSLLSIESPFRGGVISGDRAGVIKVWRIDGVDSS
jgi:phosphoinositide-3-kinase regulatory subunit 4